MSVNSKMTAVADRIRTLLGLSGAMGLDAMANNLGTAQNEVNSQENLLDQALTAIAGKASGGSGNSGAFSASEEFIWTAPSEITANTGQVTIPHSLGVKPDGYHIMALETETGTSAAPIANNIIYDWQHMIYVGVYPFIFTLAMGANESSPSAIMGLDVDGSCCTSSNIAFLFSSTCRIPAGKQYRVLVYKR